MLIEFKVANFRSFNEEQTFSLVAADEDTSLPENLIPCGDFSLVKAAGIYGANASGKSNLIKALQVMQWFVVNSATKMNHGDKIPDVFPFRLPKVTDDAPSFFEVTFLLSSVVYRYGFTATVERVHREWLYAIPPDGEEQLWFERIQSEIEGESHWQIEDPLKENIALLEQKTRYNALALSVGPQFNVEKLQTLYEWFREKIQVLDLSEPLEYLVKYTARRSEEDIAFKKRVLCLMQDADRDIESFVVQKTEQLGPGIVRHSLLDFGPYYRIIILRRFQNGEEIVPFLFPEDESKGTQRFFGIIGPILDAIDNGRLLLVDEMESSLHTLLTRSLIELFQSEKIKNSGAQLVFATQDTVMLDLVMLRRDQMWLVEKRYSASHLFSISDFKEPEEGQTSVALQRDYLSGRYGGIPILGAAFEDREI